MESIITITSVVQVISISLGVGSSTLAVLNFFNAIADGTIDPTERRMMGVTYIVLRVAMVLILTSTTLLMVLGVRDIGYDYFTAYIVAQCVLITVLFINASLMTARIMPSSWGPAIQAGTWYLLGFGMALASIGLATFSFQLFIVAYAIELLFAYFLINSVMHYQRYKLAKQTSSPLQ
jgi:hypothetical protein